ncbi:MAG: pilin, partial [Steroidobacterales bacterium]
TNVSGGKYESAVTVVAGGVVQITYGQQANKNISGSVLALTPYIDSNKDVLWDCGSATAPTAGSASIATGAATSASLTTVSAQYLPTACHS